MNIAFGTVLIFLLFVPGIIFRRAYYYGIFAKAHSKKTPLDELMWAIVPGIILQVSWIVIVKILFSSNYTVNFHTLSYLLMGSSDSDYSAWAFASINENIGKVILYNSTLCIAAFWCGRQARLIVRRNNYDKKYLFLRFDNQWFYIVTGEILDFPDNDFEPKEVDFVQVDILTKTQKETIIYSGIIKSYYLSKEGGLESVLISGAQRKVLNVSSTNEDDSAYYSIPGDFIVVPYSEILNINVRYINSDTLINEAIRLEA